MASNKKHNFWHNEAFKVKQNPKFYKGVHA